MCAVLTIALSALAGDLLAAQIGPQVLHDVEHVVSAEQEKVEILPQVRVNILPDRPALLPHVFVLFGPLMEDVNTRNEGILGGTERNKAVAFLRPSVPRRADVGVVVLLHRVDAAEDP